MADNRQYDSLALPDMVLPFAPNAGQLVNKPYLTGGHDTYCTWGGTLKKRPGTINLGATPLSGVYPIRLWVYETLEASPYVYIVGSFLVSGTYQLKYLAISQGSTTWTTVTERRGCNHSQHEHEGVVRRGKLYIKGDPLVGSDADLLGSVYLDGTGGTMTTHDWGALAPQTALALTNPSGWSASAHNVTVNYGWIYTYAYVKASGQITNQAVLQTNPDASPSSTGPFTNKIPAMTVTGLADTTEYPYINIYRTTDGGGTFFFLYQIANTGSGSISFSDTYLASGSGNQDPIPDTLLDTFAQAPSTTSNSTPPSVEPPSVTGSNAIQRCSHVEQYASRIWYAIGEYLFYSANEELVVGVPEESFPSGITNPNFFRFNYSITQLVSTPNGLLVMTQRDTSIVLGTSRATFNPVLLLSNVGAAYNQRRASCGAADKQAWLTQDYRVAVVDGSNFSVLTNPLGDAIKATVATNSAAVEFQFWTQEDKEYLIIACHVPGTPADTQWFVYDLDRARRVGDDFWFTPWDIISTCLATGPASATDTENKLYIAMYDGTNFALAKLDYTGVTATDVNPSGTTTNFGWQAQTSLLAIPPGDHVNYLRIANLSPVAAGFTYNRTTYSGDSDPILIAFFDDFYTTPISLQPATPPARRPQSLGFHSLYNYDIRKTAKYAAFQWIGNVDGNQAEIHNAAWLWLPESGA